MTLATPLAAPAADRPDAARRTRVAIAGATGFAGQELVRILARHPAVTLTAAMSSAATSAPRPLPALARIWDGAVVPLDIDRLVADADVVFLALPEAASAELGPQLVERGVKVIDLSGAFRIRSDADRQRWYPATAALPAGTAYGFSERHQAAIKSARLISNPGCYPTAALMALAPLSAAGLLRGPIVIDAKSGHLGCGQDPIGAHPLLRESRQRRRVQRVLTPAHGGDRAGAGNDRSRSCRTWCRSIAAFWRRSTRHSRLAPPRRRSRQALQQAYADAPFVRLTGGALPEIKHVAHTNFCDIGWKVDAEGGRIVLVAVLDNLVKGAAGSAVQNLNILLGLDERTGLL